MNININPNSELHQSIVNVPDMVQVPEMWVDQAHQFQQAMMRFTSETAGGTSSWPC